MNELILIGLIVLMLVLTVLFDIYFWRRKDNSRDFDKVSRIIVEVWYYDSAANIWKFWEDLKMCDWMKKNGRYLSEIDPSLAEKYAFVNWIAWKDDTTLPKPADFINRADFDEMYKLDLSGPYGCKLFDDQVVR